MKIIRPPTYKFQNLDFIREIAYILLINTLIKFIIDKKSCLVISFFLFFSFKLFKNSREIL